MAKVFVFHFPLILLPKTVILLNPDKITLLILKITAFWIKNSKGQFVVDIVDDQCFASLLLPVSVITASVHNHVSTLDIPSLC